MSARTEATNGDGPACAPHPLCAAWRETWTADAAAAASRWSDRECTFVPFDSFRILAGRPAIATYVAARAAGAMLLDARWSEVASWTQDDAHVLVANLDLKTQSGAGAPAELRRLRLLVAGDCDAGEWRLRHVAEAMPALLVEAIGAYERDAAVVRTRLAERRP